MTTTGSRFHGIIAAAVATAMILAAIIAWSMIRNPRDRERQKSSSAKSERTSPREDLAQLALARRAAERGEYEKALEHTDHATEIQPDSIPANLLKAELLFRLYRADEMRPALENILRQDSEHFEAHANMAFALRYSGELDESEKHIEWCLLRRRDFLPLLRMRAQILRDRGDSVRALTEIHDILNEYPEDIETRILEAEILLYEREFEAAYLSLRRVSDLANQNHRLAALIAQACQLLGKEDEAKRFRSILNEQKRVKPNQ